MDPLAAKDAVVRALHPAVLAHVAHLAVHQQVSDVHGAHLGAATAVRQLRREVAARVTEAVGLGGIQTTVGARRHGVAAHQAARAADCQRGAHQTHAHLGLEYQRGDGCTVDRTCAQGEGSVAWRCGEGGCALKRSTYQVPPVRTSIASVATDAVPGSCLQRIVAEGAVIDTGAQRSLDRLASADAGVDGWQHRIAHAVEVEVHLPLGAAKLVYRRVLGRKRTEIVSVHHAVAIAVRCRDCRGEGTQHRQANDAPHGFFSVDRTNPTVTMG